MTSKPPVTPLKTNTHGTWKKVHKPWENGQKHQIKLAHQFCWIGVTLPETNSHFAPEKRPKPNRKGNHIPTIHF